MEINDSWRHFCQYTAPRNFLIIHIQSFHATISDQKHNIYFFISVCNSRVSKCVFLVTFVVSELNHHLCCVHKTTVTKRTSVMVCDAKGYS